ARLAHWLVAIWLRSRSAARTSVSALDPQSGQCSLRRFELGAIDRQLPNSLARRREDRVGDRGYHRRRTRLTDAPWRLGALDQMDVDQRRLVDAQHPVVVKIALLDAAVFNRDLAEQGGRNPKNYPALHLCLYRVRVDDRPAIDGADHALYADVTLFGD